MPPQQNSSARASRVCSSCRCRRLYVRVSCGTVKKRMVRGQAAAIRHTGERRHREAPPGQAGGQTTLRGTGATPGGGQRRSWEERLVAEGGGSGSQAGGKQRRGRKEVRQAGWQAASRPIYPARQNAAAAALLLLSACLPPPASSLRLLLHAQCRCPPFCFHAVCRYS